MLRDNHTVAILSGYLCVMSGDGNSFHAQLRNAKMPLHLYTIVTLNYLRLDYQYKYEVV